MMPLAAGTAFWIGVILMAAALALDPTRNTAETYLVLALCIKSLFPEDRP